MLQSGSVEAHVRVREVAIHITNHTVRSGDRGLVVVGASAEQGDLSGELQAAQVKLFRLLVLKSFLDCSRFRSSAGASKKPGNLSGAAPAQALPARQSSSTRASEMVS